MRERYYCDGVGANELAQQFGVTLPYAKRVIDWEARTDAPISDAVQEACERHMRRRTQSLEAKHTYVRELFRKEKARRRTREAISTWAVDTQGPAQGA
jgi:hypothetical protein